MRLGVFQFDVVAGEPETNLRRIAEGTRQLEVDLLVLPELCTSGYLLDRAQAEQLAIELPGDGVQPFLDLARHLGAWVIAGVTSAKLKRNAMCADFTAEWSRYS